MSAACEAIYIYISYNSNEEEEEEEELMSVSYLIYFIYQRENTT